MSPLTAALNRTGRERAPLSRLRAGLRPGVAMHLMGDQWVLSRATGRQEVFDDVVALLHALEAGSADCWAGEISPGAHAAALCAVVPTDA